MRKALAKVPIDRALTDEAFLGAALGDPATWRTWLAILRAAFALPMSDEDKALFIQVAGDREAPQERVRELWCISGRRSGKSRVAAAVASYIAAFPDHSPVLSPGEVPTVLVLAASKAQAASVHNYVKAFLEASPFLRRLIGTTTTDEIRLTNNVTIAIHTSSFKTVRGRSLIAAVFDETAFWRDETSSQPDVEVYRAVLPALATTKGMLVSISSPYATRGLLFSKFQQDFGRDNPRVLVVKAGTSVFNPTVDVEIIEQAHRDDPEAASAEWDARFRSDLQSYIDRRVVEMCIEPGVYERPYQREFRYVAFCDPSSGQRDSMCLGIAHREGQRAVLDCLREVKAPFSPADVVTEFAAVLQAYQCITVKGDAYAVGWVKEAFEKVGVRYVPSELNRSEVYLTALPALMSRAVALLDNTRLIGQVSQLERRTMRSGRDAVDHMRGMNDDLANAALGAVVNVPPVERSTRNYFYGPRPRAVIADPLQDFRLEKPRYYS